MTRPATALTALLVTLVCTQSASAVLCSGCRGKVHDNQFGICAECRGNTRSTATQLCPGCSAELVRCEWCYKKITDTDRNSGKPTKIDPRKSGDYKFDKWMYRYQVSGLGTSRSQVSGRLAYGGKEVPAPQVNDYYKTPWGFLYWVGESGASGGKRGWLTSPVSGVARRGRQLTPQEPGGKIVRLGEADHRREIPLPVGSGIVLNLPGNPKSGSQWRISKITGGSVEPVTRRPTYTADPGRSGRTSSSGLYCFKLKTVRKGKATIEMAYGKTASAYGRPERTYTVTIEVQ